MKLVLKFAHYFKPHKKIFFIDLACALGISLIDLTFPLFSRNIINQYIPNNNLRAIIITGIVLIGAYIVRAVFDYIVNYWGHVAGARIEYDMRRDLFKHYQTMDIKFFDNRRTGKLMSRLINDLNNISELAHHGPEDLFISGLMICGSFVILMNIEWRLTLIIFAFIPIIAYFTIKKSKQMRINFRVVKERVADVNAQVENSLSGIRVSKSFTNEEYEILKFDEGNTIFKDSKITAYKTMAEFFTGIRFNMKMLSVLTVVVGGYFVYIESINYGDLLAYILYITFFMDPIKRLVSFAEQYQEGMSGIERFAELMEIEPSIKDTDESINLEKVNGDVEIKDVSFSYNENEKSTVLNNINLKVTKGKTLALVGPSGGGKTTLCHLIPRFYDVDKGEILIDNNNIKNLSINSLRRNIGLVQQSVFLFTGTIRDNISYGNIDATEDQLIRAAKDASIHDFIMSQNDGYDTFIGERGIKLSGGQQQRISIARVFLKNPPILILDEATSALDNTTELLIQEALERLSKGRTTIVIAHRLSTIKNADEIVILTEQGIVERGTHESLIKEKGEYSKLYNSQFKGFIPDYIEKK